MNSKLQAKVVLIVALSLPLVLPAATLAKRPASFKTATYDKLVDGSGPQTNDQGGVDAAPSPKPAASSGPTDLTPLKLESEDSFSVGKDGQMKATVSESVEAKEKSSQKDPTDKTSVIGGKNIGDKLLRDAKRVNIQPLAIMNDRVGLVESETEAEKKAHAVNDLETQQLTELWNATINRNPDIQYVINRLQPNSNPNHATSTAMKMLSGALFNAIQAVPLLMPGGVNYPMMMGSSAAASSLASLLDQQDKKNLAAQRISQQEATILYKIVRETADKLVDKYRNYKKYLRTFSIAQSDLQDLQSMVASTRASQDAAKQLEMEYTIRKAQRDIDCIGDDVRLNKQNLVDLAGDLAVQKLDLQIAEEQSLLQKLMMTGPEGEKLAETDAPAQAQSEEPAIKVRPVPAIGEVKSTKPGKNM